MLTGVIFDLDGVLANSHPIHFASWKMFLGSMGVAIKDRALDEIIRDGRTKEEILRHFFCELSDDELCKYSEQKDLLYREQLLDLVAVRGVRHFLDELTASGITAAVASSGSHRRVHHTLEFLRLKKYFEIVSTADEFKAGKSNSHIYTKTAQRMGVAVDETLVFEDSPAAVQSAAGIGMKCIGIADGFRSKALLDAGAARVFPDFVEISLRELQDLFFAPQDCTARVVTYST